MSQPSTGFAVAETPGFATNTRNRRSSSAQKQQQQVQVVQQVQRGTAAKQAQTSGGRRGGGGAFPPLPPLTGAAAKLAKQRAKEAAIADAGGLIFDATGKPVFLPQGVASFYGDVLMRPFIKLDAATGKPVLDRPFQPKLPNAPLIEWGRHSAWKDGGMGEPPLNAVQAAKRKQEEAGHARRPMKPRAAWLFYADDLIKQATNARDRFEGDDKTVRQLIINEVRGTDKRKRHMWVTPSAAALRAARRGGKWARLNAVEQEKYLKMHNADVERYDREMEAWLKDHPEERGREAERAAKKQAEKQRAAAAAQEAAVEEEGRRRAAEEPQAAKRLKRSREAEEARQQEEMESEQEVDAPARRPVPGSRKNAAGSSRPGARKGGAGGSSKAVRAGRKRRADDEEAEYEGSEEEQEEYVSEPSSDEDYLDAVSELQEEEEQAPRHKQQKQQGGQGPSRKVLASADSKLNARASAPVRAPPSKAAPAPAKPSAAGSKAAAAAAAAAAAVVAGAAKAPAPRGPVPRNAPAPSPAKSRGGRPPTRASMRVR